MRTFFSTLLLAVLLLGGCERAQAPAENDGPGPAPIVVYVPRDSTVYTAELFAGFTAKTGVRVTIKHDDTEAHVENVIRNQGAPRADILVTTGVQGIWRAADQGALRPITSKLLDELVPARFKDPDKLWFATAFRPAVFAYDVRAVQAGELTTYESLADERFRGKLCLTTSALPANRALVAMLVDQSGKREAELLVRGWVANLALPPLASQEDLREAVSVGNCAVGLVMQSDIDTPSSVGALRYRLPQPAFVEVDGIGIARHASQPELARQFIEWLLAEAHYPDKIRDATLEQVAQRNAGIAGWRFDDAVKLVERAAYR